MKRSDVWLTPDDIFKNLCNYWDFKPNMDVAASAHNTKCEYYIDEKLNAHKLNWICYHDEVTGSQSNLVTKVWINPPTSQIREYCEDVEYYFKGYRSMIEILMILPANSFCNPYMEKLFLPFLESGDLKIKPVYGKIKFLKGEPDPEQKRLAKFKPYKVGAAAQNWISLMFRTR